MKQQLWIGLLGLLALTVGCSGQTENKAEQITLAPESAQSTTTQEFTNPLVKPTAKAPTVPTVPGLLRSTNAKARAESITTGRRDPFAVVPSAAVPIVIGGSKAPRSKAIAPLPKAPAKQATSAMPQLPPIQLPPLRSAPLPNLAGSSPLPPLTIPSAAAKPVPPSPTALAESVEVSGVVQVGNRWTVIVKESSASSSRYVAVGDYVENGRVLVKKIVSPGSTEPVVILQQGGVEIRKSLA